MTQGSYPATKRVTALLALLPLATLATLTQRRPQLAQPRRFAKHIINVLRHLSLGIEPPPPTRQENDWSRRRHSLDRPRNCAAIQVRHAQIANDNTEWLGHLRGAKELD